MTLEHPDPSSIAYDGARPALLIGDSGAALDDARALLAGAGLRLAGECALADAAERLERQAAAALVWTEFGAQAPEPALTDRLARLAESGTPIVVAIAPDQIDPVDFALSRPGVQILVEPSAMERAAAVSLALAARDAPARVSDVGRDNAVRLRQLSDEVGRIAASLARLSTVPEAAPRPALVARDFGQVPEVDGERVRAVIRARRLRARFFDEQLFADPAWDMLLDLLAAEIAQHRVPVSSLCIAAAVPATTALRWIKTMTDAGLFVRRADPHDGRRIFVELSPEASAAMRQYFAEAGEMAGL
ncbi:MarR family winged helix-turn-helix transcriptional regulator [Sphingomonas mesophila]|uniref:MarR family winged helix-turn-helix transcriptional regulator n=1 Tax=Sphingomonas mesophila TaxID=2303576 RepID=UPI000E58AED8|nr:MarR family winged helix-turn-helix transcriptional regulator [Sphingomonas mesophila]